MFTYFIEKIECQKNFESPKYLYQNIKDSLKSRP